jgi:hypothetical protein
MTTWQIIATILGILFAASWATIIPVCLSLWGKLKKLYSDYENAVYGGVITDAERVIIADDAMACISDAANIFQFLANLIAAILAVIKTATLLKKLNKTNAPK